MDQVKLILGIILAIGLAFAVREFFPKERIVRIPPEIQTRFVHDTVVDTLEVIKWREKILRDTVETVREVRIAVADTVQCQEFRTTKGMTALQAGEEYGDSTLIHGFFLFPAHDGSIVRKNWRENVFTLGPIKRVAVMEGAVPARIEFGEFPPPPCEFWCKAKIVGITGAIALPVGIGLGLLAR